jgi:hypothetical protein
VVDLKIIHRIQKSAFIFVLQSTISTQGYITTGVEEDVFESNPLRSGF